VSSKNSKNRVGWWFLWVGLAIILLVAADMVAENLKPSVKLLSKVTVDGNIQPGEYTHHFFDKKSKYNLYWRIIGNKIYFGMHSPKKGWVAVGLGAKKAMQGADIYIAYVKGGKTYLSEEYGNTPFSHVPLKSLGAKPVVEKYAGKVCSKGTFIEFERPLKVNSKYAKSIQKKKMTVIFAFANAADFTTYHGAGERGTTHINFFATQKAKKTSGLKMWVEDVKSYQIAFLIWGVLFLMVAFIAFVTGWIEGDVSKPVHIRKDNVEAKPFFILVVLGVVDIVLIFGFVVSLFSNTTPSTRGFLAALVFAVLAAMVALYRHYFIDEEVVMHDMDDQLPW